VHGDGSVEVAGETNEEVEGRCEEDDDDHGAAALDPVAEREGGDADGGGDPFVVVSEYLVFSVRPL
jgi:hypothetical protein